MKIKEITDWSERWSNPLGTMDVNASVADGVLVDLSLWGTSIIGLVVKCPVGRYFGSLRAPGPMYDHFFEFLRRNQGRKLREVMDAEIDIEFGIVALNIDDLCPPEKLVTVSDRAGLDKFMQKLNGEFIQRHERHFRKYLSSGRLISALYPQMSLLISKQST